MNAANKIVEVFRTDVGDLTRADLLLHSLHHSFPGLRINFDLDDHDNILRVEGPAHLVSPNTIIAHLRQYGCTASLLAD